MTLPLSHQEIVSTLWIASLYHYPLHQLFVPQRDYNKDCYKCYKIMKYIGLSSFHSTIKTKQMLMVTSIEFLSAFRLATCTLKVRV